MWKKAILWMLAAATAFGVGQFLISIVRTYGLPPFSSELEFAPRVLVGLFAFVLIAVDGADAVRDLAKAGLQITPTQRFRNEPSDRIAGDVLTQRHRERPHGQESRQREGRFGADTQRTARA